MTFTTNKFEIEKVLQGFMIDDVVSLSLFDRRLPKLGVASSILAVVTNDIKYLYTISFIVSLPAFALIYLWGEVVSWGKCGEDRLISFLSSYSEQYSKILTQFLTHQSFLKRVTKRGNNGFHRSHA